MMKSPDNQSPPDTPPTLGTPPALGQRIMARCARVFRFFLFSDHYREIGFAQAWRALLGAVLVTMLFFTVCNQLLLWRIERDYDRAVLTELKDAADLKSAAARITSLKWADAKIEQWLSDALVASWNTSASHQLELLLSTVKAEGAEERARLVRRAMTGQPQGSLWFWLRTRSTSGSQLLDEIERAQPTWAKIMKLEALAPERRVLIQEFIDALQIEMRPSLRSLRRLNGGVQWLTVCVFFTVVILCLQRIALLQRVLATQPNSPEAPSVDLGADDAPAIQELALFRGQILERLADVTGAAAPMEIVRSDVRLLMEEVERGTYRTLSLLVSSMPSLGFIGTVVGMGNSLLAADSLFSPAGRQHSISVITQELGFAFDTTLVALLGAIFGGALVYLTHRRECRAIQQIEAGIKNSSLSKNPS